MLVNYIDYLESVDDSHSMTTSKKHIKLLCELVNDKESNTILELGSYLGISTAALALAYPKSLIVSVDLSDHIKLQQRQNYWNSLKITNILGIDTDSTTYLQTYVFNPYSLIFHDSIHGDSAMKEYVICAQNTNILAIHDFEQLNEVNQQFIKNLFANTLTDFDDKGRCLFIGFKGGGL